MATTPTKTWTEKELLALPQDGCKYEVVNGELYWMPAGNLEHSAMCANVGSLIHQFCLGRGLGVVVDGQTGFYMKNGDLLSPDVSYINVQRWQSLPIEKRRKFFRGSPDLAVEVTTPSEPVHHIYRKVKAYLENDTVIVWVVDLFTRSVTIHTRTSPPKEVKGWENVTGEPVLPGFSFVVASDVFEEHDALWQ